MSGLGDIEVQAPNTSYGADSRMDVRVVMEDDRPAEGAVGKAAVLRVCPVAGYRNSIACAE